MILFETSTSVFELLWDIALALFVIRLSFIYFSLAFATGCFITYLRMTTLSHVHHLTQPQSELMTLAFFVPFICLWARWITVYYEIPKVAGFRLAIGGLAMVFMVAAELVGGLVMYQTGWREWVWETDPVAGGAGIAVLLLFGLMPWLMMAVEKGGNEGNAYHGHGEKDISAAV